MDKIRVVTIAELERIADFFLPNQHDGGVLREIFKRCSIMTVIDEIEDYKIIILHQYFKTEEFRTVPNNIEAIALSDKDLLVYTKRKASDPNYVPNKVKGTGPLPWDWEIMPAGEDRYRKYPDFLKEVKISFTNMIRIEQPKPNLN